MMLSITKKNELPEYEKKKFCINQHQQFSLTHATVRDLECIISYIKDCL